MIFDIFHRRKPDRLLKLINKQKYTFILLILNRNSGQGRLLCVTSDNKLHLLEIQDSRLTLVNTHHMEGRLKAVSSLCVESARKRVLVGTEGGNIYFLRLWNMTMEHEVIFQDKVYLVI